MSSTGIVKMGWLTKEGGVVKSWKKRWFILDGETGFLTYYSTKKDKPDDKSKKGVIVLDDLANATASSDSDAKPGRKNLFQIVTPSRTYYLMAENGEDKEAWLSAINGYLAKLNPPRETERRVVTAADFQPLKVIGRGNFGKVLLVRLKDTKEIFAMKVLSKKHIIASNEIEHTMAECDILQKLHHPFLVNMHYAFQDEKNLYLVLDFVNGGELFFHLRNDKKFPESRVRFYAAEIILGLEYLHNAGVLYRDLKLENLLLTSEGHIVLTDFGLSKQGLLGSDAQTQTFCGTPEYMAPEMIAGRGYGKSVDWWSFGSLVFEMLTGLPPFYSQDVQLMYRRIVEDRLAFPPYVSETARGLISLLLEKDPARRICDPELIKRHPFFDEIDWNDLYRRKVKPPYVPDVKSNVDLSQIDPVFTSEDPTFDMTSVEEENGLNEGMGGGMYGGSEGLGAANMGGKQGVFNNFNYVAPEHDAATKM